MQDSLTIIEQHKDKVSLEKDINLEYDLYFYEREKNLQGTFDDIASGKMPTYDFESSMNELIEEHEN